jgi:hypothetical protein
MDETCSLCGYEGKYAIKVFGGAVRQRVLKASEATPCGV